MNVSIQVLYANEPLQTLHFAAPGALLVGRHVDCDVRLEDSLVSRVHARVDLGAQFFSVEDLSSNGTGLNDGVLHKERQDARYGDCVYIGQFALIIDQSAPQVAMAPPAAGAPAIAVRPGAGIRPCPAARASAAAPRQRLDEARPCASAGIRRGRAAAERSVPPCRRCSGRWSRAIWASRRCTS